MTSLDGPTPQSVAAAHSGAAVRRMSVLLYTVLRTARAARRDREGGGRLNGGSVELFRYVPDIQERCVARSGHFSTGLAGGAI
jgi:hypothetical protein